MSIGPTGGSNPNQPIQPQTSSSQTPPAVNQTSGAADSPEVIAGSQGVSQSGVSTFPNAQQFRNELIAMYGATVGSSAFDKIKETVSGGKDLSFDVIRNSVATAFQQNGQQMSDTEFDMLQKKYSSGGGGSTPEYEHEPAALISGLIAQIKDNAQFSIEIKNFLEKVDVAQLAKELSEQAALESRTRNVLPTDNSPITPNTTTTNHNQNNDISTKPPGPKTYRTPDNQV